ncbi:Exosome complex component rrp4 [Malassezia sp. CBS 17886]|nr:Exosome complex component rrp4 [Malassezia sp. CBS 17886]
MASTGAQAAPCAPQFRIVRSDERAVHAGEQNGSVALYVHASDGTAPRRRRGDRIADVAPEERDSGAGDDDGAQDMLVATPGQGVASSTWYMRGHGCYVDAHTNEIVASLCGAGDRVNKLISVHPTRTRYRPEVGDLVVGRITEVQSRRWKVDIGSKTDASLQLSSINLPGGIQRKKLESDELQMRSFFQEGDLVVAEVQSLFQDGSVGLHTRSLRYGKLRNGVLVSVAPSLIRRHKSHFLTLPELPDDGVDLVLGLNGLVWVAKHVAFDVAKAEDEGSDAQRAAAGRAGAGIAMDIDGVYSDVNETISRATRHSVTLVCFVLSAFAHEGLPVTQTALEEACAMAMAHDIGDASSTDAARFAQHLVAALRA